MMTLSQYKQFADVAKKAYLHACEKHPVFTDKVSHCDIVDIRRFLNECRKSNDEGNVSFASILEEELAEYIEASLVGNAEAAKRELLDVAAVIMREWERISK